MADNPKYPIIRDNSKTLPVRKKINFLPGTNTTVLIVDNEEENTTEITISATGGGGSGRGYFPQGWG